MEGFIYSENTHILNSSFFNFNHWVKSYFIIALLSAKKQIFTDMEQLDKEYLWVYRVYFINQLGKSCLLIQGDERRRGKGKARNELNSVLAIAGPSARAVMRYF